MRTLLLLLGLVAATTALRVAPAGAAKRQSVVERAAQATKAAVAVAACSAALLSGPTHAIAAPTPTLNEAIVEVSETSYPILKALKPEAFQPFTEKIANLVLDIKPEKLGKSIDLGIDVFNSVPEAKLNSFNDVVKEAFADLKPDSCTLVPLPPPSVAERFGSIATSTVDAGKIKAVQDKWGGTLSALAKTDNAICLPSVESLDKLALAQAEVGRSFGGEEVKAFGTFSGPLLKRSITIGKVLPLLSDAKRVAPSATPKQNAAFQAAGKDVEAAAKMELFNQQRSASRSASSPAAGARAAAPAAVARAPGPTAEEIAAKREAAKAKEEAERKAFKEAELARIAELKAKRAAIEAAKGA